MSAGGSEGEGGERRAAHLTSPRPWNIDGKIVRNDASFEKDDILGRYGAIPFIGNVRELLGAEWSEIDG
ncbi:hypothetical protein [Roseiflexus sp.]|uniref:hypothetical protein n=1 Tax=Roseiflexus sp. TaxID=2562120 RepID=UPI0021DD4AFD|nr:hypothetical protein [Roseiflexus sp.]GIV99188.1 MAG: hypothetical protein KatS3mg058_0592 [Roseiflexus sp.]